MAKSDNAKATETSDKKQRRSVSINIKKSYLIIALLVVVIGVGGGLGYHQYDKVKKENKRLSDPQASAAAETERIKSEVSKLIDVPQDEQPTIASVVDASKLNNQAFFAKAQNGDRVLMYAKAKKAILYRPSSKKIIEVAPINLGNNAQAPTAQQAVQGQAQTPTEQAPAAAPAP